MSFPWIEYLHLARQLYNDAPQSAHIEAAYRSVISRSYYAVYHIMLDYMIKKEAYVPPSKDISVHSHLLKAVQNSSTEVKYKSYKYQALLSDRRDADYQDNWNVDLHTQCRAAISYSEEIVTLIARLSKS